MTKIVDMNTAQLVTALKPSTGHLRIYRQADTTWCSELVVSATKRHEAHGPTLSESLKRLLEQIRRDELFA